jgi:hypothetical protein
MTYRQHLADAGKDWDDVREWALTVRAGKVLRWSPKELAARPAGVAIAYLEAGCPSPDGTVLRGRGTRSDLGGVYRDRNDSRSRGLEAANARGPSAEVLLADYGLDWKTQVRPWCVKDGGFNGRSVKPGHPHQGAVLAYLKAHPEHAESAASSTPVQGNPVLQGREELDAVHGVSS